MGKADGLGCPKLGRLNRISQFASGLGVVDAGRCCLAAGRGPMLRITGRGMDVSGRPRNAQTNISGYRG